MNKLTSLIHRLMGESPVAAADRPDQRSAAKEQAPGCPESTARDRDPAPEVLRTAPAGGPERQLCGDPR
jgi:hypothetical protein